MGVSRSPRLTRRIVVAVPRTNRPGMPGYETEGDWEDPRIAAT